MAEQERFERPTDVQLKTTIRALRSVVGLVSGESAESPTSLAQQEADRIHFKGIADGIEFAMTGAGPARELINNVVGGYLEWRRLFIEAERARQSGGMR